MMDVRQKQSFLSESDWISQVDCDVNCPATELDENKQNFTYHVDADDDSNEYVEVLQILDPESDVDIPSNIISTEYQHLEMGETKICPLKDQTIVDNCRGTGDRPVVAEPIDMEGTTAAEEKQAASSGSRKTTVDETVINFDAVIRNYFSMEPLQKNNTCEPILNRYDLLTSIKQHINLIRQKQSLVTDGYGPICGDRNCSATEMQENEQNYTCDVQVKEDPDEIVEVFEILEPESNSVDIPLNITSTEYQHLENKISPLINQTIPGNDHGGDEKETKTENFFQIKTEHSKVGVENHPISMDGARGTEEKQAVSSGSTKTKVDESVINAIIQNYFSMVPLTTKHARCKPIPNQGALLKSIMQHINLQQSERNIFNIIEKRCKQEMHLRIVRWREILRLRKYNPELTEPEEIAVWEIMCEWRRRCIKDCRIPEIREIAHEVKRFYSFKKFNPKNTWIKAFRNIFKNVRFNNNSNNTRKLPRNIMSIYNAIKHNIGPSIVMRIEAQMARENLFYAKLPRCHMKTERNADELIQRLQDDDFKRKVSITKRIDYCEIIDCIALLSQRLTWKDACAVIHEYFTLEYLRLWPIGNPPNKFNVNALRTSIMSHVPKQRFGDKLILIVKYIKNILLLYMANNSLDIKFLAEFFGYSEKLVQKILDSKILKKLADSVIRNAKNLLAIEKEATGSRFSDCDIDKSESENNQMFVFHPDGEVFTNVKMTIGTNIEADDPLPSADVVDFTTDDQMIIEMSIKSEPTDQILTLIKTEDTEISDYQQALLQNLDENFRSEMNGYLCHDMSGNI